jgi:membrane protease YdiL (CAAX protease family)
MIWCAVIQRFPLSSFFTLAYTWTWLCWWTVYAISAGHFTLPISKEHLATLGQFGPFAAALLVTLATAGRAGVHTFLSSIVRWRARPRWALISLLLLPATMIAAIILYSLLKRGSIDALDFRESWSTLPAHFVYLLLLGGALGEEPGWRGFALPRLQDRCGLLATNVLLGLLHAGWHLPLWWLYPPPCPFPMFVVGAVLLTFLFTWLWNHTNGSVFYSLLFHASLSTASVRLPEMPAYHIWLLCLLAVVLVVAFFDRKLGFRTTGSERIAL